MIEDEIKKLSKWLADNEDYTLPSFKELPTVHLYMEQVVSYVNSILAPLLLEEDTGALTSFMVNNYVKAKIIKEPDRKKYNNEHLGYLFAISFLKRTLSMSELSLLIQMDGDVSSDKSALYQFFRSMLSDVTNDVVSYCKFRVDDFYKMYERMEKENPAESTKFMADSLALTALRLSVKASVYSLISSRFLDTVSAIEAGIPLPEGREPISKKERKRAEKNAMSEAERVAAYVEKGKKKKREDELKRTMDLAMAAKAAQEKKRWPNPKKAASKKGKTKKENRK